MKQEFSKSWLRSKQVRKQRKYRYNAPLHLKHKFLSANLSKELRKKYGKRSLAVRKGDEVLIMRGSFAKKNGKVLEVALRKNRVSVEGINRKKLDGTKVNVFFNASNLQIKTLNLDDRKRIKQIKSDEGEVKKKEIKQEVKENASDKIKGE
jgi:large subunit ribosomal protein L24